MEIHARSAGEVLIVGLEGELDAYWAEEADRELRGFLEQGKYRLVLDLAQLTYMSSAGLRILHRLQQRLTDLGGSMVLAAPQAFVRSVLKATGFDQAFRLFDEVEEGVAAATPEASAAEGAAAEQAVVTSIGEFRYACGGPDGAALRVTGQADDFLFSRATMDRLTTVDLPSLGYSLGVGALGERGPGLLDRLGEILSVPGAVYWLPGDGRQVPDFLVAGSGSGELPVHLLYNLALEGPAQCTVHFEAAEPAPEASDNSGVSLSDICDELMGWTAENIGDHAGVVGLVIRADIAELWSVGLKRSPREERAPANGQRISHRENLRDWLNFPTDPAFANHTVLAVGVLVDRERTCFSEETIHAAFGSPGDEESPAVQAHIHGAVLGFIPELAGSAAVDAEVAHVVEQGELVSVGHLLPATRLRRAVIGLWIPQSP